MHADKKKEIQTHNITKSNMYQLKYYTDY